MLRRLGMLIIFIFSGSFCSIASADNPGAARVNHVEADVPRLQIQIDLMNQAQNLLSQRFSFNTERATINLSRAQWVYLESGKDNLVLMAGAPPTRFSQVLGSVKRAVAEAESLSGRSLIMDKNFDRPELWNVTKDGAFDLVKFTVDPNISERQLYTLMVQLQQQAGLCAALLEYSSR